MKRTLWKYHALRNDFLVLHLPERGTSRSRLSRLAKSICDRTSGIGSDGMVVIQPAGARVKADYEIQIFNQDGSWAEKSGNGLRIAAAFLSSRVVRKRSWILKTARSIDRVTLKPGTRGDQIATGLLGEPSFEAASLPMKSRTSHLIQAPLTVGKEIVPVTCLSVGNPHCVVHCANFEFDWPSLGARLECHPIFPKRTNVEFVRVVNKMHLQVREWERGVGVTASSGTGAAAALAASVMLGLAARTAVVSFEAGSLEVSWDDATNLLAISGPITFIGKVEVDLP